MDDSKRDIRFFEDLKVWKCARKLQREVAQERYRLTDQMIRSSRSGPRNIAEGYGRYHYQENIQFCRHSRGSLNELLNDFITAFEENYVDRKQLEYFKEEIAICHRLLNGYIRYLKEAKKDSLAKEDEAIYVTDPH